MMYHCVVIGMLIIVCLRLVTQRLKYFFLRRTVIQTIICAIVGESQISLLNLLTFVFFLFSFLVRSSYSVSSCLSSYFSLSRPSSFPVLPLPFLHFLLVFSHFLFLLQLIFILLLFILLPFFFYALFI